MMHGPTWRSASPGSASAIHLRRRALFAQRAWCVAPPIALAAVHFAAAGWLLTGIVLEGADFPLEGTCALIFGSVGAVFAWVAFRVATQAPFAARVLPPARRCYWRWCGLCLVSCYAITLPFGGEAWAARLFWTSFASSHLVVWLAVCGWPATHAGLARGTIRHPLRIAAWTLYSLLMLPLACELALRLYALAADDRLAVRYVTDLLKLPAGGERLGRTVNSQGYWDDEFHAPVAPAALRVAALGDDAVLCGDARSNFLVQLERRLPGVDVLNFGVPRSSPREYASQFQSAVAPCRPDVVLVFFSVASDVTEAPPLPGPFDWRGLHLVQRTMGLIEDVGGAGAATPCAARRLSVAEAGGVDRAAALLEVCRVPVPDAVQSRWRAAFAHLDRLIHRCTGDGVVPTLVVVPSEFQIDERLCQTLCRRAGYRQADQIDIDLPQRRLAAYAKDRRIHLLDLMPHLRASKSPAYVCESAEFNEHGNSLTATILSEWLETQYAATLLAGGS